MSGIHRAAPAPRARRLGRRTVWWQPNHTKRVTSWNATVPLGRLRHSTNHVRTRKIRTGVKRAVNARAAQHPGRHARLSCSQRRLYRKAKEQQLHSLNYALGAEKGGVARWTGNPPTQ